MGKRSDFERVEKDFYRTIDKRAVEALAPFLEPETRFIEPCAGYGDLLFDLEARGHKGVWASDNNIEEEFLIEMPQRIKTCDAFSIQLGRIDVVDTYDYIITNPPWSRPILHQMIEHFSKFKPTWLLFDADWAHTKQSAPYMKWCRKIVSVGRLIWIPGTTMSGKDNCAWYLFDQNADGVTEFVGR
jgi:hypothetical protein